MDASTILTTLLWGAAIGCIYILLATGLNIIFGVMKLVNFAHGQLLMVGAFIAYSVTVATGMNALVAILVSMAVVAVLGIVVERYTFRKVWEQTN
jgi:branched-chain amino acid transport system permease protein